MKTCATVWKAPTVTSTRFAKSFQMWSGRWIRSPVPLCRLLAPVWGERQRIRFSLLEIPKALSVKLSRHSDLKGEEEIDVVTELRKGASTYFLFGLPTQTLDFKLGFEKVFKHSEISTPSVSSEPCNYKKHQGGDVPILDGRYNTLPTSTAVPVEVFHLAFAHFLALARNDTFQPQDDVVQFTANFIHSTRRSWPPRVHAKWRHEGCSATSRIPAIQTFQLNKSSADHMMPYSCRGEVLGTAALAIIEESPSWARVEMVLFKARFLSFSCISILFLTIAGLDTGMLLSIVYHLGCRLMACCARRHNRFPCHHPPAYRLHLARWRSCHWWCMHEASDWLLRWPLSSHGQCS